MKVKISVNIFTISNMKTLNDFFAVENLGYVLTTNELISVRGGDTPPEEPSDPFEEVPPSTVTGKN